MCQTTKFVSFQGQKSWYDGEEGCDEDVTGRLRGFISVLVGSELSE